MYPLKKSKSDQVSRTLRQKVDVRTLCFSILLAVFVVLIGAQPVVAHDTALVPSSTRLVSPVLPSIDTAQTVEELRTLHDVQRMRPIDDERNIADIPGGIYGFAVPWMLNSNSSDVVGGTGVGRLTLVNQSAGTLMMEVHKTSSGQIYIIGYLSLEDVQHITNPGMDSLELTLFMQPVQIYTVPIAIPIQRLLNSRFRSVNVTYVLDLVVAVGETLDVAIPTPVPISTLRKLGENPIVVATSISSLRTHNGVHELQWLDNDQYLSRLPNGVFGYITPWLLNTDRTGTITQADIADITIERKSGGTVIVELHKTAEGQLYIVGYLSEESIAALKSARAGETVSAIFTITPYEEFRRITAIPVERLLLYGNRTIRDGNSFIEVIDVRIATDVINLPLVVTAEDTP